MSTRLPPGPRPLPMIGNVLGLLRDPLSYLTELTQRYGDVAMFRLGRAQVVFLNDPKLIDRVIRDRSFVRSEHTRRGLSSLLGRGLLTLEGAAHLRHRRLMQPAFHRERIQRYVSIMAAETYKTLDGWQSGQLDDLREDMMRLTFSIVAQSLFNTDTSRDADRVDEILKRVGPAVFAYGLLSRIVPFHLPPLYRPRTARSIEELHDLVGRLVRERRADDRDHGDLMSMLLASRDEDGSALSDDDVRDEALTILLAGHDTTAHTVTWAFYLLSKHPEIQQAVADEVHAVAGDRELAADDLVKLPLVDRVIRETLRMYPPAWWADRTCGGEIELGGYTIPANTLVVFSTYVTQRDPRYFPNPDRFDPERFRPENAAAMREGAYLPFGAGVHACIGNTFAMMESRMIVAAIAQRFSFRATMESSVRPRALITLGMAEPFPGILVSRPRVSARVAS